MSNQHRPRIAEIMQMNYILVNGASRKRSKHLLRTHTPRMHKMPPHFLYTTTISHNDPNGNCVVYGDLKKTLIIHTNASIMHKYVRVDDSKSGLGIIMALLRIETSFSGIILAEVL